MKQSVFLLMVLLTLFSIAIFLERTSIYLNGIHHIRDYASISSTTGVIHTTQYPDPPPNCRAIGNIVFVKTHKTGSTTLRTILNRYGYFNNLSFLMHKSKSGGHIASDLRKTPLSAFLPPVGVRTGNVKKYKGYNISNTHMMFRRSKLTEIMAPGSIYITILRDPVEQWLSAFQYFHVAKTVRKFMGNETDPVKVFLSRPKTFQQRNIYAWNNQLYDLGVERRYFPKSLFVEHRIKGFGKVFDLVLITEYFDESLVLLRKLLCWTFEDIVYVKMRAQPKPLRVGDEQRKQIKTLNRADAALYGYFNRTLWRKVKEYGPTFERDLRRFRSVLTAKYEECVGDEEVKVVSGGHQNIMYQVKNKTIFCTTFVNHGGVLTKIIKQRQQLGATNGEKEDKEAAGTTSNEMSNSTEAQPTGTTSSKSISTYSTTVYAKVPTQCESSQGNVVFVKTHKTGSTTLTSILNRFGYSRNLSFVQMAASGAGHFNYHTPSLSHKFTVFLPPIGVAKNDVKNYVGYNISAVHVRYNRRLMEALVNHSRVYYMTILREPVTQLLSAIQYFDVPKKNLPPKFFNNGSFETSVLEIIRQRRIYENSPFAWNNQIYDLGINRKYMRNANMVTKYISKLGREMDLVLIMEYFDESLILLKKLLCWEFEDILYVKRRMQPSTESIRNQTTLDLLKAHNNADRLLYEHFNKTLWDKIAAYGPSFDEDLRTFRNLLNSTVAASCIKGKQVKLFSSHPNIVYIPVDNPSPLCLDVIDATDVVQKIRMRQRG